jgi:hypothetical protein
MGSDAHPTAPRQMNTLATGLKALVQMISSAELVVGHFQALRDTCSDEQWEKLVSGPLADLLDACSDLEYDLER